jgi:hypothetical protein
LSRNPGCRRRRGRLRALGAAVLVLVAVAILRRVRAAIVDVEDAVVVVVRVGAAVLVLEAVEVLRLVGTLIFVVLVAVPSRSPIEGSNTKPSTSRTSAASKPVEKARLPPPSIRKLLRSMKSLMPPMTSCESFCLLSASLNRYVP